MSDRLIRIVVGILVSVFVSLLISSCSSSTTTPEITDSPESTEVIDVPALAIPDAIRIEVGRDIQAVVESHPAGTTFLLASGVHRLQSITPRDNDIFIGEDGAVLSGAVELTEFTLEDDYWVVEYQTEPGRRAHNYCYSDYPLCYYPEDLFFNDQPFRQVDSLENLEPDTWYFDYEAGRVYLADNPTSHMVEISSRYSAVGGDASGVIISNLTIEKYANPAQIGAINGGESQGWVIHDVMIRLNHGTGIRIGDNMQLLNSQIIQNGQIGVAGVGDDVLIEGNEIAHNNFAGYRSTWEAGGTKFVATNNIVVRNNYVHHNDGPGLWTDHDNHNALYEDNIVMYNQRNGIYHEISGAVIIRNNVVKFNGLNYDNWLWGSQILVSSSYDAEVYGNQVVVGGEIGNGIGVVNQDRGLQSYNNYFHDNVIIYLSDSGQSGVVTDFNNDQFWEESNNRFDSNTYYASDEGIDHWAWDDRSRTWEELQTHGQELNGTIIVGEIPEDAESTPEWIVDIASPF